MADLTAADIVRGNLEGAKLTQATIRRGQLTLSGFRHAGLTTADFSNVHLSNLTFEWADLKGVSFKGAWMTETSFRHVSLDKADFTSSQIYDCVFADADLSGAVGLSEVRFGGPTSIDVETLGKSKALPLSFLRGCGLPDLMIDYLPSLTNQPIQFYSCFISYSTQDQEFADRLHADLQNEGVRCWFAPHDLRSGRKVHEQIDEAIRVYDRLLLILSPSSINSEWVKTEIAKARRREVTEQRRMLFPIGLLSFDELREWECFDGDTGKDSAREVREYFVPDFGAWKNHDAYRKAFKRLLDDLKNPKQVVRGSTNTEAS